MPPLLAALFQKIRSSCNHKGERKFHSGARLLWIVFLSLVFCSVQLTYGQGGANKVFVESLSVAC